MKCRNKSIEMYKQEMLLININTMTTEKQRWRKFGSWLKGYREKARAYQPFLRQMRYLLISAMSKRFCR